MKRSEQEQVHSVEVSVKASNEDITRQFSDLYKMVCGFETLEYCEEGSDPKSRLKSEIAGSMRSFFSMCFNADLRAMDDLADRLNQVPGADVDGQLLREIFMEFLEEDIVKGLRECAKMSRQYSALGAQGVSGRKPYCS